MTKFIDYLSLFYLIMRHVAWGLFLTLSIYKMLTSASLYACLWPTPIPVPVEIHVPTEEEIAEDIQKEKETEEEKLQKIGG